MGTRSSVAAIAAGVLEPTWGGEVRMWSDAELDEVIEDVIVDAYNDSEQLTSFECAFQDADFPISGRALGRAVAILAVEFDGDPRRGLRARLCVDGHLHMLDLLDVAVANEPSGTARLVAAYRRWWVCPAS